MEYLEVPLDRIIVGHYNLRGEKASQSSSIERLSTSIYEGRGYSILSASLLTVMAPIP
jgi:hypothetical protein